MTLAGYVLLGVLAGIFSGLLGIGGGLVVVPGLVYLFGMTLHKAQGTILAAFLPPVAFLAFWKYYQSGNVDLRIAALLAMGIFIGGYFGAAISLAFSEVAIRRVFGIFLLVMAVKFIWGK